jgi:acetate kinase
MKPANPRILTINGGSSSIKFALFEAGNPLRWILKGEIERIGLPEAILRVKGLNPADNFSLPVTAPDHSVAVGALMDWIEERSGRDAVTAMGVRRDKAALSSGCKPHPAIRSRRKQPEQAWRRRNV